jgi:hypothetical protein
VSAFVHLGRALFGARYSAEKEFAMLTCYLDEAGGPQDGFIAVCGWVSTAASWEQFEIDWRLFLASKPYDVPYFHMKEFAQSTGPFKKWKDNDTKRRLFLSEAAEIVKVCARAGAGILCNVHYRIFDRADKRYMIREALPSPYAAAGRACVAQVDKWVKQNKPDNPVEFIFEDGGPDKQGLAKALNTSIKYADPIFRPSRNIKDKKGNERNGIVQLQAADFLAYEIRKHRREIALKTGRDTRKSLYALLGSETILMRIFRDEQADIIELCNLESVPTRS